MIVDDSAVIRGFLNRWLEAEPDIEVVALANNGVTALREFQRFRPEIVILDIEMPEMDGMTALPKLIALDKDVQIIMASTLTRRNANVSLQALAKGAADYIAKPESTRISGDKDIFQQGLTAKIRALGGTRRARRRPGEKPALAAVSATSSARRKPISSLATKKPFALRADAPTLVPNVIAIGSSTGGPQALFKLFEDLKGKTSLPILITQHMPATFTAILAEHINKIYDKDVAEAKDGDKVVPNRVYVAPGEFHMTVAKQGNDVFIRLTQDPPENFCRPSVEPMLRSLQSVYNNRVLTVILTGMGQDGLNGCKELADTGAVVLGQDEETSVVWGMPGAVANAGICNAVLPLNKIAQAMERAIMGRPS
ncbi:MAG: chemotaxis response regulator protein-glutamate methylesterase [Sneathiella sp.]|nr:MAG: chemotaxis response regulator protein-glutamate methylesterase [Sneathiella sp.]